MIWEEGISWIQAPRKSQGQSGGHRPACAAGIHARVGTLPSWHTTTYARLQTPGKQQLSSERCALARKEQQTLRQRVDRAVAAAGAGSGMSRGVTGVTGVVGCYGCHAAGRACHQVSPSPRRTPKTTLQQPLITQKDDFHGYRQRNPKSRPLPPPEPGAFSTVASG